MDDLHTKSKLSCEAKMQNLSLFGLDQISTQHSSGTKIEVYMIRSLVNWPENTKYFGIGCS